MVEFIKSSIILILFLQITIAFKTPECGDWESYKDEKCFKIFKDLGLKTWDEAKISCSNSELESTLVTIHSQEEQDFLANLFYNTNKLADSVWIGARKTNNFKWIDDNSDLIYTNWATGSPSNITGNDCVQISSDNLVKGKWIDEPCSKSNLVVCQKKQSWSISRIQEIVLANEKNIKTMKEDYLADKKENEKMRNALEEMRKTHIPIGFIYIQLPTQSEPKTLWSMFEWQDVTSQYAGLFFRAEGGGSAAFDQIQNENCPSLVAVHAAYENYQVADNNRMETPVGAKSQYVFTGRDDRGDARSLAFEISGGEVRPRNQAMRIWKRIK